MLGWPLASFRNFDLEIGCEGRGVSATPFNFAKKID